MIAPALSFLGLHRPPGPRDFRDVSRVIYGIGAQKAGTTWLYTQLERHPEVHLSRPKEVHYWDTIHYPHLPFYRRKARQARADLRASPWSDRLRRYGVRGALRALRRTRDYDEMLNAPDDDHRAYQAFLTDGARDKTIVGDISPGYAMMRREGFAEMDAVTPDARYVFIMRDPVDRLWSNMRHNRSRGFGDPEATDLNERFERAIEATDQGPFQRSDYAATIRELEAAVPRERIGYFFFETFFSPAEMARLQKFLGIGPLEADFSTSVNKGQDGEARPRPDLVRRARERLAHVYEVAEARFGDDLPDAWRADAEEDSMAARVS